MWLSCLLKAVWTEYPPRKGFRRPNIEQGLLTLASGVQGTLEV
jgi:hypothetical protein